MIDDATMAGFRMAATLVHALPGLELQVAGDGAAYRVGRDLPPGEHHANPCGFRMAVAEAHRLHREGRRVGVAGACPGERPTLTLSAGDGAELHPGGVCVAGDDEEVRVVVATLLDPEVCRDELTAPTGGPEDEVALGLHHDPATDVTLVHAHVEAGDAFARALARRAVEAALARLATAELLSSLTPTRTPG